MVKLFFSAIAIQVPTEVIQVFSGYSDVIILEINESTSEIQNLIISKDIISTIKRL